MMTTWADISKGQKRFLIVPPERFKNRHFPSNYVRRFLQESIVTRTENRNGNNERRKRVVFVQVHRFIYGSYFNFGVLNWFPGYSKLVKWIQERILTWAKIRLKSSPDNAFRFFRNSYLIVVCKLTAIISFDPSTKSWYSV